MRVFRAGVRGGGFDPWSVEEDALRDLKDRITGKGPFTMKFKADTRYSRELGLVAVINRVDKAAEDMREDQAIWVKTASGRVYVFDAGTLHLTAPPAPSGVSSSIAKVHEFIFKECERQEFLLGRKLKVVTMGYTVCKKISGTSTPSQHCPGPPTPLGGNAVDFVIDRDGGTNDIEATDNITRQLDSKSYVAQVLWRGVPNHYPGHAHISGAPMRTGWPSCL